MSKHTPGPWHTAFEEGTKVKDNGKNTVAWLQQTHLRGKRSEEEVAANARLIAAAPKLKDALAAMLDFWGGYECPEVDAAIAVMQEIGEDRWSMQAQMEAAKAEGGAS